MDSAFLAAILAAVSAGAVAKAQDVASDVVKTSYETLKALLIRKLGKSGAVQSVEDEPESETAYAALAEALVKIISRAMRKSRHRYSSSKTHSRS